MKWLTASGTCNSREGKRGKPFLEHFPPGNGLPWPMSLYIISFCRAGTLYQFRYGWGMGFWPEVGAGGLPPPAVPSLVPGASPAQAHDVR